MVYNNWGQGIRNKGWVEYPFLYYQVDISSSSIIGVAASLPGPYFSRKSSRARLTADRLLSSSSYEWQTTLGRSTFAYGTDFYSLFNSVYLKVAQQVFNTHFYHSPIQHDKNSQLTRDEFMMASSNGNIFRVTGPLWGEFTGDRWIPLTKASDAELWCFLDLRLNKRLNKQSWGWWFETPTCSLWRHCNVVPSWASYRISMVINLKKIKGVIRGYNMTVLMRGIHTISLQITLSSLTKADQCSWTELIFALDHYLMVN